MAPRRRRLFAAFVGRGLELCKPDGYLGAITSRAGMFLATFEAWRRDVLLGNRLMRLPTSATALWSRQWWRPPPMSSARTASQRTRRSSFVSSRNEDRPDGLAEAIAASRAVETQTAACFTSPSLTSSHSRVAARVLDEPICPPTLHATYRSSKERAEDASGLQTGDDFRFVRAFWEVDPRRIARSREETKQGGDGVRSQREASTARSGRTFTWS